MYFKIQNGSRQLNNSKFNNLIVFSIISNNLTTWHVKNCLQMCKITIHTIYFVFCIIFNCNRLLTWNVFRQLLLGF